jgi:hypothetical protein
LTRPVNRSVETEVADETEVAAEDIFMIINISEKSLSSFRALDYLGKKIIFCIGVIYIYKSIFY